MDSTTFDAVSRLVSKGLSRRDALRRLAAGSVALAAGGVLLPADDASARRRRKKHRKHDRQRCGRHGDGCGALNEDNEPTAPYCCHSYACVYASSNGSSSWTCQLAA